MSLITWFVKMADLTVKTVDILEYLLRNVFIDNAAGIKLSEAFTGVIPRLNLKK